MAWLAPPTTGQRHTGAVLQHRTRAWFPFGLIIVVMSVIRMTFPAAPAQAVPADRTPNSNHPLDAFQARPEPQLAGSGQRIFQTDALAALTCFTDMLLRWPMPAPNAALLQLGVRVGADDIN